MKHSILVLLTLVITQSAFAGLAGRFECDDKGRLELADISDINGTRFSAKLTYRNAPPSILGEIAFDSEKSLEGDLMPGGDIDILIAMGRFQISSDEKRITLKDHRNKKTNCYKF